MLEQLLKDHGSELISAMTAGSPLDRSQAESLLPPAVAQIADRVQGGAGGIDLGDLLGGGSGAVSALLEKLDVAGLARAAGLGETETQTGLEALIPAVLSMLGNQAGGAQGLLSMLGGSEGSADGLGALGGIAGKLFGK